MGPRPSYDFEMMPCKGRKNENVIRYQIRCFILNGRCEEFLFGREASQVTRARNYNASLIVR